MVMVWEGMVLLVRVEHEGVVLSRFEGHCGK